MPRIRLDRSGESREYRDRRGNRVFYRRNEQEAGYHLAYAVDGSPTRRDGTYQYFTTPREAGEYAAGAGLTPA